MIMNKAFYLFILLFFVSCSNDEPEPEIFMQIASITSEEGYVSQQFSYDSYGRIVTYRNTFPAETVTAEYEYVSDNLIKITTKDITFDRNGTYDIVRAYQDNLHLENGRAIYCEGVSARQSRTSLLLKRTIVMSSVTHQAIISMLSSGLNGIMKKIAGQKTHPGLGKIFITGKTAILLLSKTSTVTRIRVLPIPSIISMSPEYKMSFPYRWADINIFPYNSKEFSERSL